MKIAIGCDHAGYEYKEIIKEFISAQEGIELTDFGTHSIESVDYPEFAHLVAKEVGDQKANFGILICGSANGVAMTANKNAEVRCAICWSKEITALARQHNNANVIAIPARFLSIYQAKEYVHTFLNTEFEGGRHQRRVGKIACC